MIVGVPLFATVLEFADKFFDKRLKKKGRLPKEAKDMAKDADQASQEQTPKRRKRGLSKYEKKVLRLKQEALADGSVGDLTRFERFLLDTYNLACKYNIFSEYSDENFALFSAEEAAIAATLEDEKNVMNNDTEKNDEQNDGSIKEA